MCFLWNDSGTQRTCTSPNQVAFYYGGNGAHCWVEGYDSSWSCSSDRALKENFEPLDARAMLRKLAGMPVWEYNMKGADASIRHVGPVSQDFRTAFGLGKDDKLINTFDAIGVTMASLQGLYELLKEKDAQIQAQEQKIEAQQKQNESQQQQLERLNAELAHVQEANRAAALENAAARLDLETRLQRLEKMSSIWMVQR